MNTEYLKVTSQKIIKQRGILLVLSIGLMISNVLLCCALFMKKERVILVPPIIHKSFWIEEGNVSQEYLTEMSLFMAHQVLDVTPSSAGRQRDVVLGYVAPSFYNPLKKRLQKEEEFLRQEQVSTSFKPTHITADSEKLEVEIIGEMNHYVAGTRIKNVQETYILKFEYRGQKLSLTSFKLKGEEDA